jgi:uncharacterized BrkB/YihY/UPF0761 family membrane protein
MVKVFIMAMAALLLLILCMIGIYRYMPDNFLRRFLATIVSMLFGGFITAAVKDFSQIRHHNKTEKNTKNQV